MYAKPTPPKEKTNQYNILFIKKKKLKSIDVNQNKSYSKPNFQEQLNYSQSQAGYASNQNQKQYSSLVQFYNPEKNNIYKNTTPGNVNFENQNSLQDILNKEKRISSNLQQELRDEKQEWEKKLNMTLQKNKNFLTQFQFSEQLHQQKNSSQQQFKQQNDALTNIRYQNGKLKEELEELYQKLEQNNKITKIDPDQIAQEQNLILQQYQDLIQESYNDSPNEQLNLLFEDLRFEIDQKNQVIQQLGEANQDTELINQRELNENSQIDADASQKLQDLDQILEEKSEFVQNLERDCGQLNDEKEDIQQNIKQINEENDQFRQILAENIHLFGIDPDQFQNNENENENDNENDEEVGENENYDDS